MQTENSTTQIVNARQARARFSGLVKWASKPRHKVIVKRYGKPAVVIISYQEYEEIQALYRREQQRQALTSLEMLRQEARRLYPDLTAEEAYRQAGLAEEIIQAGLKADEALRTTSRSKSPIEVPTVLTKSLPASSSYLRRQKKRGN